MSRSRIIMPTIFLMVALMSATSAYCQGGFGEADANGDEKITAQEMKKYVSSKMDGFDRFDELLKELDEDKDGSLSEDEFENRMTAIQAVMSREKPKTEKKPEKKKNMARNGRTPRGQGPSLKVGDAAPTFVLKALDGKSKTDLADFKGKKPVVLIFGSYT